MNPRWWVHLQMDVAFACRWAREFNQGDLIIVAGCWSALCVTRTQPEHCTINNRHFSVHVQCQAMRDATQTGFTYFPPNYKVLTTPLLMSKAVRGLCC